jgi:hypothetical protein
VGSGDNYTSGQEVSRMVSSGLRSLHIQTHSVALGKLTRVVVPGGVDFVKRSVHGDVLELALASCGQRVDDVLCPRRSTLRIAARTRHTSVGTSVNGCQGASSLGRGRGSRTRTRVQSIGKVKLKLVSATFPWQRLSDQDDEARGVGL